jgi:hypothetical protein
MYNWQGWVRLKNTRLGPVTPGCFGFIPYVPNILEHIQPKGIEWILKARYTVHNNSTQDYLSQYNVG